LTRRRVWRRPDHRAAAEAKWRFDRWAGSLQAITSAIDDANRHLARCEQTEHELTGPYRHYQEAHEAQVERDRWLATHPGDVAWADDLVQRINTRTTQLGAESAQSQPPHLVELLGPLPEYDAGQQRWEHLAGHLEGYRQRWRLPPDELAGHNPTPGVQARHWAELAQARH
jgi:hypothetical protein